MKRTEFNIEISAENVLESLGVTRQSELYEEMQAHMKKSNRLHCWNLEI